VVDRDNGNDLTQLTLSQLVLSHEKHGPGRLVDAGGEVIHDRGQALLDYVRKTLNVPSDLKTQMERRREDLEERADEAMAGALRRLRIPSHTDIDRINERLDRISAQLKKLGATEPSSPRSSKRKPAR
jgi:polyhydroxyalkanoate synthesis regulator phasin